MHRMTKNQVVWTSNRNVPKSTSFTGTFNDMRVSEDDGGRDGFMVSGYQVPFIMNVDSRQ